ncbi:hypothetical protein ACHAWF_004656, partial [Thalassiosira exigua]
FPREVGRGPNQKQHTIPIPHTLNHCRRPRYRRRRRRRRRPSPPPPPRPPPPRSRRSTAQSSPASSTREHSSNIMSESLTGAKDVQRFEQREEDVTCCIETLCCGSARLIMGEEEVELKKSCLGGICNSTKRGPYGEMGTVDTVNTCCFSGFKTDSLMAPDQAKHIGCGCEGEKVNDIVTELKRRQAFRGDRAKVRMAEATLKSLDGLNKKVR